MSSNPFADSAQGQSSDGDVSISSSSVNSTGSLTAVTHGDLPSPERVQRHSAPPPRHPKHPPPAASTSPRMETPRASPQLPQGLSAPQQQQQQQQPRSRMSSASRTVPTYSPSSFPTAAPGSSRASPRWYRDGTGATTPTAHFAPLASTSSPSSSTGMVNSTMLGSPLVDGPRSSIAGEFDRYPRSLSGSVQNPFASQPQSRSDSMQRLAMHDSDESRRSSVVFANAFRDEKLDLLNNVYGVPFLASTSGDLTVAAEDKEDDDALHDPNCDYPYKEKRLGRRAACNFFFLGLLIVGALCVFVVWPVLAFTGNTVSDMEYRKHHPPTSDGLTTHKFSNFRNLRSDLVDSNTPESAYTRTSFEGKTYDLVFSDEFEQEGRTFYSGDDIYWQAADLWYGATEDLEYYTPDAITTKDGTLQITLDAFRNHNLDFRSGMLQSWNKLCFSGGIIEISASLPKPGDKLGLWPGLWTLGNLARPGYLGSTQGLWPYAYNSCDAGITPNQSSTDGLSQLPGQRLPSCTCEGEDHPNPGHGRGAPEIDIIEGTVAAYNQLGNKTGVASQSFQLAPMDPFWYINYEYVAIHNKSVTQMNSWTGGPVQQAASGATTLNTAWYGGHSYQTYGFDYTPGENDGRITWYVGDDPTWTLYGPAMSANGNVEARNVPAEPLSIIMNLGLSQSWVYIDFPALDFPTTMYVDYVRIYQDSSKRQVTCDPEDYPTYDYIKNHTIVYENNNYTNFTDAGYDWPRNRFMHGCT